MVKLYARLFSYIEQRARIIMIEEKERKEGMGGRVGDLRLGRLD